VASLEQRSEEENRPRVSMSACSFLVSGKDCKDENFRNSDSHCAAVVTNILPFFIEPFVNSFMQVDAHKFIGFGLPGPS